VKLTGKRALVTGAGGAIGGAIARRFAAEGATIVATDLNCERLDALAESLPGTVTIVADLGSPEGIAAVIAGAGDIDILSINAGGSDGGAALDEISTETWNRVLAVHLTSAFELSRSVVPGMLAKQAGVILFMSSIAGLRGGRTGIAYTTAKWAMVGMAQNIASSLGAEGIRSFAICPGNIAGSVGSAGIQFSPRALANRGRDRLKPPSGQPEDVANLVAFLASEEARHMNGAAIPVDAGWLAF
jgi:NAD(P)-dependent dehydrogenase (short-subunit alcohol dehydrogenase family)